MICYWMVQNRYEEQQQWWFWDWWACGIGERTVPIPLVSDCHLQQLYKPQSNDENQLSYLPPPTRYNSSNIIPQENGFPSPSSVCSNNLQEYQVLRSTIVHQNDRTKHPPYIVAPQHEVSVPLTAPIILIPKDVILIIHLFHIRGHLLFTIQTTVLN